MTIFSLAELLHKTVGEIKAMPTSEFYGWMEYLNRKAQSREDEDRGNLLSGDSDSMISALTGL